MADLFRTRPSHSFKCKHVFKVPSEHSPLQMFLFDITWNSHNLKSITLGLEVQVFIWTFASWYFISFFTNFFHKKKKFSMENTVLTNPISLETYSNLFAFSSTFSGSLIEHFTQTIFMLTSRYGWNCELCCICIQNKPNPLKNLQQIE